MPLVYRALAILQVAALSLCGATANAEQSEPAAPGRPADPQTRSQTPPSGTQTPPPTAQTPPPVDANKQNPSTGAIQKPGVQPNTGQNPPTPLFQTPAQQKYGLPRTPIIGGPVDIDVSKPLSLERAIQIGLARQNQIAIAVAQRDQEGALLTVARSSYFPQILPTLSYVNTRSPTYFVGTPITSGTGTVVGSTGSGTGTGRATVTRFIQSETRTDAIAASQNIFDSGIREANVGFSRRNLFAAEYNIANIRQTVVLTVTQDYYSLLRDKRLVDVQTESVKRAQTTLESIQAQVAVGNAAQSDTLQAQSDLANARVALLQAQNTAYVDEASLKNAMGVVTSVPLILSTAPAMVVDPTPDPRTLEDYVKLAYQYRLDLKQQQEVINAQGYQLRIAHINAGVTVNANVTEGYQLDPNAGEERTFTVAFSYPLFDGGNTRAVVRENKAILEQDRRSLDQLQQNTRLAVEQDYLTREVSRQQVVASQTAVDAGQINYDAALEKQRNGLINVLDVINAEVQLVTAQVQLVQSVYNFYISDAGLQRDIGQNDPQYVPNVPQERRNRSKNTAPRSQTMLTSPTPTAPGMPAGSASTAVTTASTAVTTASTAVTTASTAVTTASTAVTTASTDAAGRKP
jgi:outer membrane protein